MSQRHWHAATRWDLPTLWRVASMQRGWARVVRLVTAWLRPPLVTCDGEVSTMVASRVVSRSFGAAGLVAGIALLATVAAASPWWVVAVLVLIGFGPLVAFAERVVLAWELPVGHVRWSDVRAASPGSGAGERSLGELLERDGRPAVLEVESDASGLVALYSRLGFVATGRTRSHRGRVLAEMTHTRERTDSSGDTSLEPTEHELAIAGGAALGAIGLAGIDRPFVGVAVFLLALAALSDWRMQRISNSLLAAGGVVLMVLAVAAGEWHGSLAGAAVLAGPLLVMNLVSGGRSPGMGDVKLAGVAGLAIGAGSIPSAVVAMIVGLLAGGLFGAAFQSVTGRREFPLGVPLAAVFAAVLLTQAASERGWL